MAEGIDLATRIRTLVDTTGPVTMEEATVVRRQAGATPRVVAAGTIAAVLVAVVVVVVALHHRPGRATVITSGPPPTGASSTVTRGQLTVTLRLDQTVVPTDSVLRGELVIDNRGPTIRRRGECFALSPTLFLATPPVFEPVESCGEPAHVAPVETIRHGLTTVAVSTTTASAGQYLALIQLEPLVYSIPVPPSVRVRVVDSGFVTTRLVLNHDVVRAGDLDPGTLVVNNRTGRTLSLSGCHAQGIDYTVLSASSSRKGYGVQTTLGTCLRHIRPGTTRVPVTIITTLVPCVPPGPASSDGCRSHSVPALYTGAYEVTVTGLGGYPDGISLPSPVLITLDR